MYLNLFIYLQFIYVFMYIHVGTKLNFYICVSYYRFIAAHPSKGLILKKVVILFLIK